MEIWSTIVAIFGFVGAAASEFHLLCATKTDLAGVEARMARTEIRARDIMGDVVEDGKVDVLGGREGSSEVAPAVYRISRFGRRNCGNM